MASKDKEIKVFRPTWDQFKDFLGYIEYIEQSGGHEAGAVKVIPPEPYKPRAADYNIENIDIKISNLTEQHVVGTEGVYSQSSLRKICRSLQRFHEAANSRTRKTPTHTSFDELETIYWKNVNSGFKPLYGSDVPGSLFDENVVAWNLNKLPSILEKITYDMPGINVPFLYFGMWKTSFGWHIEDMDLYSISYHHVGQPKTWYIIPPASGHLLEKLANEQYPDYAKVCSTYLRHKMLLIDPVVLKKYNIPFQKITQEAGEFVITFPYAYHSGFNHGYNIAEAVNFALPRWIPFGVNARLCECGLYEAAFEMDVLKEYVDNLQNEGNVPMTEGTQQLGFQDTLSNAIPTTTSSAHLNDEELVACEQLIQLQSGTVPPLKLRKKEDNLWMLEPTLRLSFHFESKSEFATKQNLPPEQQNNLSYVKGEWVKLAIRFMKKLFGTIAHLRLVSSDGILREVYQISGLYDLGYQSGKTKFLALNPQKKKKAGGESERLCEITCHFYPNEANDIVYTDLIDTYKKTNQTFYNKVKHHFKDIMDAYFQNIKKYDRQP